MQLQLKNAIAACQFVSLTCLLSLTATGNAPADIVVVNGDDAGPGSLRQAILDAAPDSTISFGFPVVINLTTGELLIDKNLTISGLGSALVTVNRDPNASQGFRLLEVASGATVAVTGVTLADGALSGIAGGAILNSGVLSLSEVQVIDSHVGPADLLNSPVDGGGCVNAAGATMILTNCSVTGNSSNGFGGGIVNDGDLTVQSSTISGNTAANGGGIYSNSSATITNSTVTSNVTIPTGPHGLQGGYGGGLGLSGSVTLLSDTISGNQCIWDGGGIDGEGAVVMTNCILAGNGSETHSDTVDLGGTVESGGYNLVGVAPDGAGLSDSDLFGTADAPLDPKLGPLQDNGGLTFTMALLPGSPALDQGISAGLGTDEIGAPRTVDLSNIMNASGGDGTDIGAVEEPLTIRTFANISTRLSVQTGDDIPIAGFIITGTEAKTVIVRGIGPSLPVSDALADPILELHGPDGTTITTNDNWQDSPDKQAIIDSTIPPSDDKESAIIMSLLPANYTAVLRGVNDTTGVGLVEVYDLDDAVDSKLANISTRGLVLSDDDVLIGGIIILGVNPTTTLVRAIGPSLPVAGALQDPMLELYNNDGMIIASNDNWQSDQEAEIEATSLAPTDPAESASLNTLEPGAYTAVVRGVNATTGVAMVEAYQLDN